MPREELPCITVVIPVYNAGQYLKNSMQCLVHQTYENLDIILINDGSTDNSAEICREHSQTDSRIRMFSQKNSGQASARNRGIEEAYGDYILFLDADDLYACDIVEYLYDLLK